MDTVDISGLNIAYQRAGTGPTLVLLHGFICDSRAWRPQIDNLSRDFDVIAWDAPGCGESDDAGEYFTMAENADCLANLLDALGVPAAHMLGLSWGGTLAFEFSRRHGERMVSLILADTYAGWTGSLGKEEAEQRLARCLRESQLPPEEWIPQWVPDAFSSGAGASLLKEYAAIMSDFHPVGFRAMSRNVTPDFRDRLPLIAAPTLLIWGEEDKRSPVRCGKAMLDAIPGAQMVLIPKAGHVSNFEKPEEFNAAVREFLSGPATAGTPPG